MSDEKKKNISEATGELLSNALSPASKQFGQHIESAGKTAANIVNISVKAVDAALLPLYGLVWGADKIKEWINHDVAERLKDVPEENLITPDPAVAGPALEAIRFTGNSTELRDMFAKLLATSMNSQTKKSAHPSYVEIIKQLNTDEAKILNYLSGAGRAYSSMPLIDIQTHQKTRAAGFHTVINNFSDISEKAGCVFPDNISVYLDNLARLKIIDVIETHKLTDERQYEILESHRKIKPYLDITSSEVINFKSVRKLMRVTAFGKVFISACL